MLIATDPSLWIRLSEVASTNDYLAQNSFPSGTVVIAEKQTAGKGRKGRDWYSRPEDSIILSIFLSFDTYNILERLPLIPLMTGAALLVTVDHYIKQYQLASKVSLKWPNDLYLTSGDHTGKLSGILVESDMREGRFSCIIGCGLNFKGEVPGFKGYDGISLFGDSFPSRDEFISLFIKSLNANLSELYQYDTPSFLKTIRDSFYLHEKLVMIGDICYTVRGLSDDGGLFLYDAAKNKLKTIYDTSEDMVIL